MSLLNLIFYSIKLQEADPTFENLEAYFRCSIAGYKSKCDVYKEKIEDVSQSSYYFNLLAYLTACTINISNLTYSLQFYDIKVFIKKLCRSKA